MTLRTRLLVPLVALTLGAAPLEAWGPVVHQMVTREAIDTLPKELKKFYKDHRLELPTLALEFEEEIQAESLDRRFAVDRLMPFPFLDLPRSEAELKEQYGGAADGVGRLPWLIQESFARLVEAFKAIDKNRILEESDLLSGLVTDMHNPLALTENSDGQTTEQHGLWVRFSVRLPEIIRGDLKLKTDAANYIDDPNEFVFSMIDANYVWVDNVLYNEELAGRGNQYSTAYYDLFKLRAAQILGWRFSAAAEYVGSYWYTAWTDAGRPKLKQ